MRRILIAPGVGPGRVLPHAAIAQALRQRGYQVVLYAERSAAGPARAARCRFREMPARGAAEELARCTTTRQVIEACRALAERVAPDLVEVLRKERIDALVTDALHLGAALAAERSGLPWATLATSPYLLSPEMRRSAQTLVPTERIRRRLGLPRTDRDSLQQSISPASMILAWTPEFDVRTAPRQAVHVGPLGFEPRGERAPAWIRRLSSSPPLVLVGSSTVPFTALTELVNQYVSEAVEALNGLPVQAVITVPAGEVSLTSAPARHVQLMSFAPHAHLMPRASVLVTHGGWGTVGRAMRAGVPMLIVPFALDQPFNARLCRGRGIARVLPAERVTAPRLARHLEALLAPNAPERRRAAVLARRLSRLDSAQRAASVVAALSG